MGHTIHEATETNRAGIEGGHLVFGAIVFEEGIGEDRPIGKRFLGLGDGLERRVQVQANQQIMIDLEVQVFEPVLEGVFIFSVLVDSLLDIADQLFGGDPISTLLVPCDHYRAPVNTINMSAPITPKAGVLRTPAICHPLKSLLFGLFLLRQALWLLVAIPNTTRSAIRLK